MKKQQIRNPLPVVPFDGPLVSYAAVRANFGWADKSSVRRYVKEGLLVRVRVGTRSRDCRISVASVVSLREHFNKCISDAEYAEKARMQSMREKKGLLPTTHDVLLDADQIIENFNEGRKGPLKDVTPETGNTYTRPASQPARRPRTGFGLVRGI